MSGGKPKTAHPMQDGLLEACNRQFSPNAILQRQKINVSSIIFT